MFIDPLLSANKRGWIEVICGSMFSGKTEELIRRLKRVQMAHLQLAIFKPIVDNRYHPQNIVSHNEANLIATPVSHSKSILLLAPEVEVVGIDEAQFFDDELPEICNQLALRGLRVIVAGLDMDYAGKPFGPLPSLLAQADYITKLHAICVQCGQMASYSYRKIPDTTQIRLGQKEAYEPRCRSCYFKKT
jgi:thymidine kinase